MKCEVKNVQSSEVFSIPPDGMIFGRSGGPANITVSDQSVSKRHARIFCKDGQWLLEDLKSVNGTVVNNRRITEPVPIAAGFVFALSKHQFEVVSVDGPAASSARARGQPNGESDPGSGRDAGKKSKVQPAMPSPKTRSSAASGGPSGQPVPVPDPEPLLPPEPSRSRAAQQQQLPPADESGLAPQPENDPYLDELQASANGGAGAVIAALPRAIAYYLANVPLMALNPVGTIRKGIENPKVPAMKPIELIAFYLPVLLFSAVVGAWAAGISTLIRGAGFVVLAFLPIPQIIGAVIGAVISGLITHWLLTFFVERVFKGETDEKTRTNAMVMLYTATALVTIPNAIAQLLDGIVWRLAQSFSAAALLLILPALLIAVTAPLAPYIFWQWMKAWRTAKWAQTLFMVLTILAALGGVGGAVSGVLHAISVMRGGASGTPGVVIDESAVKKAQEDAQKALDEAKKNGEDATKKADDTVKKAGDAAQNGGGDKGDTGTKKSDATTSATSASTPTSEEVKKKLVAESVEPPPPTTAEPAGKGTYGDYKQKRDAIEKAIAGDPTLLEKSKVRDGYEELSKCSYRGVSDAETEAYGPRKRFDPAKKHYYDAVVELKTFQQCKGTVEKLYKAVSSGN